MPTDTHFVRVPVGKRLSYPAHGAGASAHHAYPSHDRGMIDDVAEALPDY
jgi:hypothetical protein